MRNLQMTFLCLVYASDSQPQLVPETQWRDALIRLFYQDISPEDRNKLEVNQRGFQYEGEVVREVRYNKFFHGNFNLSALPHSTRLIWITSCLQDSLIMTRCWPRSLRSISLSINQIYGRPDLTTLPPNLGLAFLWDNRMTGPIDLTKLPRSLKQLSLSSNRIHQETVWYDDLPDNLVKVILGPQYKGRGIRKVCAVDSERPVKNGIFEGIRGSFFH